VAGRRVGEAAEKSEVNPAPARAEEKAGADRAPYLTNIATAAIKQFGWNYCYNWKSWFLLQITVGTWWVHFMLATGSPFLVLTRLKFPSLGIVLLCLRKSPR
jgi:hypothetical protein